MTSGGIRAPRGCRGHFGASGGMHGEREIAREREAMSIHETVQTQKWYYLHNARSAYFPINRRLHRKRHRERERGHL